MKISELSTDKGLDVLCEIAEPLGAIVTDAALLDALKEKLVAGENATKAELVSAGLKRISNLMPIILKTHRDDVYAIVAAINGVTADDIRKQNFIKTAMDIRDVVNDKAFKDFFSSLWGTEQM